MTNVTLTDTDIETFAKILVDALAERVGTFASLSWWTARAEEHYPIGTTPERFVPVVLTAADAAGKVLSPLPRDVCWETMLDGSAPVRLSFAARCF